MTGRERKPPQPLDMRDVLDARRPLNRAGELLAEASLVIYPAGGQPSDQRLYGLIHSAIGWLASTRHTLLAQQEEGPGLVAGVLASHQGRRRTKDSYGYWRRHCDGCQWAGSPWETAALADKQHREHVAEQVMAALRGEAS